MTQSLKEALKGEPDYSAEFTDRVRSIRDEIQKTLSIEITHSDQMNYCNSQELSVFIDSNGTVVQRSRSQYRLKLKISSVADYYTYSVRERDAADSRVWNLLSEPPRQVAEWVNKVMYVMQGLDFQYLEWNQLQFEVPGKYTELDRKPATAYEVLFSEIDV